MLSQGSLEKALSLEGFLKKKSPSGITGYQKRYFAIRDSGKLLAYFPRKPKPDTEPRGVIPLDLVKEIRDVDDTNFSIIYEERVFELKADNPDAKVMWVNALQLLLEKIRVSKQPETRPRSDTKTKTWKPKNLSADMLQMVKIDADSPSPAPRVDSQNVHVQIMNLKGIWQYIVNIDAKVLKNRLIYGFLNKRSKGKMKYFQKRWFVLISGAPIKNDVEDDQQLAETLLPPWMYLNHIYYFKFSGLDDDSEAQGEIPTRIVNIRIKDMTNSKDSGASFLLDVGTRIFHLNADNEEEMNRWIKAIEISRENAQEVSSSITGKPKILKKIIDLYDNHGESSLKGKILEKFQNEIGDLMENCKEIELAINACQLLTDDLISTIDGCIAARPQRLEIAEFYAGIFHKKLCEFLSRCWKILGKHMPIEDLRKLIKWVHYYDTQLRKVGITDQKVDNGLVVLSLTYSNRIFENSKQGILDAMINAREQVGIDEESGLYIVCFAEICSIVEPLLFEIQSENLPSFTENLLETLRDVVGQYQNAVIELLERAAPLSLTYLVGLCNDSYLILQRMITWQNLLKSHIEADVMQKHLCATEMSENVKQMGGRVKEYLTDTLLLKVDDQFSGPIHELHLEAIFSKIVKDLSVFEPYLEKSFMRHIWRSLLEELIEKYTDSILLNNAGLRDQSILLLTETLRSDTDMLLKHFCTKLDADAVIQEIKVLKDILDFLEALPHQIPEAVKSLRKSQGDTFSLNVAKYLIYLRSDLDIDEKRSATIKAKDTFEGERNIEQRQKKRSSVLFGNISTDETLVQVEEKSHAASELENRKRNVTQIVNPTFPALEGYLLKKSNKLALKGIGININLGLDSLLNMDYDNIYFSIKNDRLYWYKSHKALEPINSISLHDVQSVEIYKDSTTPKFKVVSSTKTLKLQASSFEERDKWIKALQKQEEETHQNVSLFNFVTKESLFEDIDGVSKFKRDLMKLAIQLGSTLPNKKRRKRVKIKPEPAKIVVPDIMEEESKSWCCCLAFLKRKKDPLRESLIIN
ncbi:unnamed protein product [Blepharisma stoltei]|uniref:PH domain-containing protein n=1 Tax=Blepharisma stoltei TaxID=1481888 RepID=A0AAU9IVA7_9CILI|nr:unnamed protein product [Blepharisma stoltei]